ncbi:hypothetical protein [Mycolicibacterium mageritense]|uniref:DUF6199 domain-containing protein n=1 Tax=Mycolicibacterium mageritense TaxID=53462 RepID=A0AAI8TNX5_MYCME|nr:hypothetical protein [Mycolicibacterium mageritense]BDY26280.1 hypothetical protein hbim_00191 [Mycolicibacterium mageritense]
MLALGIVALIVAAVLAYLAVNPDRAFYLDEGWKFRNKTEPSEAYVAVSGLRSGIAALLAAGLGIGAIVMHFTERGQQQDKNDRAARYAASQQRCESEIRPRFNDTLKWNRDGALTNRDEALALGRELNVEVKIEANDALAASENPPPPSDVVWVYDTSLPGQDKLILAYHGSSMTRQTAQECIKPRRT